MKATMIRYSILILILSGCNECDPDKDKDAFLETFNTKFSILVDSKSYNKLKEQDGIHYTSNIDNAGYENSMAVEDFDSLYYFIDKTGLSIDYYHSSSGCGGFVPSITRKLDTSEVRFFALRRAEIKCNSGKKELEYNAKSCRNIVKWHVLIEKKLLLDSIILFEPFEDKKFFIYLNKE